MVYPGLAWLNPKPPVGSPDYDGEAEHIEVDKGDIEAERADRWRKTEREENMK